MDKQRILLLTANPLSTERLRVDAETRDIQQAISSATHRDKITLECRSAVRVRDLRKSLLEIRPTIVHFSGHGAGADGIALESDDGDDVLVGTIALADLFRLHRANVQCVVFNACHSSKQAKEVSSHIPFVIGMDGAVNDDSALAFAVGFYEAIGTGHGYEEAFRHGRNAIQLAGLTGHDLPVLLENKGTSYMGSSSSLANDGQSGSADVLRYQSLTRELTALGANATQHVQCIGMHKSVPFDQIYQPTKLLFRSGLDISASAAFGDQNRVAQSIAISRGQEFHSLTVESFLDSPEDTIVFAGPGWGKTTFLHHIFRCKSEDQTVQTILIPLRKDSAIKDLDFLCRFWFQQQLSQSQRVLLLVDGYDEVPLADRTRVSESLRLFSASKRGRFILTCRDYYHVIDLPASHVRIHAFDLKDQYRFVTVFLSAQGSSLDPTKLVNELRARQFTDFLSHPLLLALACIVSSSSQTEQPRSALRLLKKALVVLQHTWDTERGVSRERLTSLDGEDRMRILKRIAIAARSPSMRAERVENITRKALDKMQINKVNVDSVLEETAQFYGILIPTGDGWEFVHRTIHDYLAAQQWVDSGDFSNRTAYEWDTRTAYAACLSNDATRVLEGALATPDGLTCAIETLTNSPDFDPQRLEAALMKFYSVRDRVTIIEQSKDGLSALVRDDLFNYFSHRFLNHLLEQFARKRGSITDALIGCSLAELRARKLRMDFTTFEVVLKYFPNQRFHFKIVGRDFVTPEMARPI